jgi:hypothetical protein
MRDALVVGQLALALTLSIVSGLMIRAFIARICRSQAFRHSRTSK